MSTFGDFDTDDAWDADPTVAAEQVAYRLHLIRRAVATLVGDDPGRWETLTRRDQDEMLAAGAAVADYVAQREPENPARAAQWVHDWRRAAEGLPAWDDLTADQRQIGVDIMRLILQWLNRQGPR